MKKSANIKQANNELIITGDLSFSNIMSIYQKSLPLLKKTSNIILNFSKVTTCDSSAIALIIEWIKLANSQKKPIKFLHLSDDVLTLAGAAGLDKIITQK